MKRVGASLVFNTKSHRGFRLIRRKVGCNGGECGHMICGGSKCNLCKSLIRACVPETSNFGKKAYDNRTTLNSILLIESPFEISLQLELLFVSPAVHSGINAKLANKTNFKAIIEN